ncbi:MAG: phosphoglucosamine mutase [Polyangiaceae bacterium]|nr:phosphoglucosamine mutase [Polyangiaceae bacterium]
MNFSPPVRHLFGTDGVRGRANDDPITPDLCVRLGGAVTVAARRAGGRLAPRIVIGRDTRLSGPMLSSALVAGVMAMGGHVLDCGEVPTPGVAHLTRVLRADAGLVISASHNPFEDNGIKVFGADGFKLPDALEADIERLLADGTLGAERRGGAAIGGTEPIADATERCVAHLRRTFPDDLDLKGIRVALDAANGAAYRVAPAVLSELGAQVVAVACSPDGTNINDDCGALHPEHVRSAVLRTGAHVGIALDGDADRVILVDERGTTVDGDVVMALHATRLLARDALPHRTVVATVMSNLGLEHALTAAGGRLLRTGVGDRYVVEEMQRGGFRFGGEQSGHLIFLDHATTGDGVLAALQVLAILVREGRPLSELARVMERLPQLLKNVTLPARRPIADLPELSRGIAGAEARLHGRGRLLVRWSGTEPKLRVMAEGPDSAELEAICDELIELARRDLGVET